MKSRAFPILLLLFVASWAVGQTVNPGRVNVVTTPWSVNWLTHNNDAAALTDLGYSAWEQSLIGSADLPAWLGTAGAGAPAIALVDDATWPAWAATAQFGTHNARHYGAKGDGVTDDTTALNNAIAGAGVYGTVYLPPGTYRFSSLHLYNPITLQGAETVRNRWNSYGAGTTLLADGTVDPAILIGGAAGSVVVESGGNIAEGIRLRNVLLRPAGGTGRGILIDGSITLDIDRSCARDIEFDNLHLVGFTDHNVELLGNVFDVRFHDCSSRQCGTTGIQATAANKFGGGTGTPGQLHSYDCYWFGNSAGPDWAVDASMRMYGGGLAYGKGARLQRYSTIIGTHIEGDGTAGGIGLELAGGYINVLDTLIYNYDTALRIGDGSATASTNLYIVLTISTCTTGLVLTDGANRHGVAEIDFTGVTTNVVDQRSTPDGAFQLRLNRYRTAALTSGDWSMGTRVCNSTLAPGKPDGYVCIASGTPGTWVPLETLPGAFVRTSDLTLTATHNGWRHCNTGAGAVVTFTLPPATVGLRYHFSRTDWAHAIHITPNGTEIIYPGTAGQYLSLDQIGASVTIECLVIGRWTITAQSGTISFT